jgi:SAM-dependent methyltransferase
MATTRAIDTAEAWDGVARGWVEHHRHVEQGKRPVTEAMLTALDLQPGHRVVELGAGPGALATELAERVGPNGEVVATDVSPVMVAAASEALAALPWARAVVADGAQLDHVGEGYDAVVCRMGLMFVDTPADGLAEARRVLRPGGRLAVGVWAGPEHNPWLTAVGMAAMGAGLPVELPIGPGGPFSLADPEALADLARRAGFADVAVAAVDLTFRFVDAAAHVAVSSSLSPALAPVFDQATPDQRAAVLGMVADADAQHATDGVLLLPGRALVLSATA